MHGHSTESDSSHNYYMNILFFYCKLLTQFRIHNIHVYGQWYFWLQNSKPLLWAHERAHMWVFSGISSKSSLVVALRCSLNSQSSIWLSLYSVENDRNQSSFIDLPMNTSWDSFQWVNIELHAHSHSSQRFSTLLTVVTTFTSDGEWCLFWNSQLVAVSSSLHNNILLFFIFFDFHIDSPPWKLKEGRTGNFQREKQTGAMNDRAKRLVINVIILYYPLSIVRMNSRVKSRVERSRPIFVSLSLLLPFLAAVIPSNSHSANSANLNKLCVMFTVEFNKSLGCDWSVNNTIILSSFVGSLDSLSACP